MRKQTSLKIISAIIILTLGILTFSGCGKKAATNNKIILNEIGEEEYVQQVYTTIATDVNKQESVYVNLSPEGKVKKVSVTDWLHTDSPQVRIVDTSPLTEIRNVKSMTNPVLENGMLYWDMDTTDLY